MNWNGSPYHTLDFEMKSRFGQKVYKIALDGHLEHAAVSSAVRAVPEILRYH